MMTYEVCASQTGEGLYSLVPIGADDIIATGRYRDIAAPRRDDPVWPWLFVTPDGWRAVFSDIAFLNHSEEPNAEVCWHTHRRNVSVRSTRTIMAGKEITMRYANWKDYGCRADPRE